MRIIITIGIILLAGCEEPYECPCELSPDVSAKPLQIDARCDERTIGLILDAVDNVNELGDAIEVVEDSDYSIQCLPGWPEGRIAHANEATVSIYPEAFSGAKSNWTTAIITHELTHWIGVHGHTNDSDSVMSAHAYSVERYNESDRELICSQLGCVR